MLRRRNSWLILLAIFVGLFLVACSTDTPESAEEATSGETHTDEAMADSGETHTDGEAMADGEATADGEAMMGEGCPASTVADTHGVPAGQYAYQYELAEYEKAANCTMVFSENPDIASLNAQITNNPELPPVEDRLPDEPLVWQPYDSIGKYGGSLKALSNATEAGTSDILSVRHVNLVSFASNDMQTIIPNVAKSWSWNDDNTELTFVLREGHKWSNGSAFTANDVGFWFNSIIANEEIFPDFQDRWKFGGEPMQVEVIDDLTFKLSFAVPSPGVLVRFAASYIQPFLPQEFFEAQMEAQGKTLREISDLYYRGSDWKDVPSVLLSGELDHVMPTLESHILVEETTEGRVVVANPYYHIVDTAGNQLPYINELDELYVPDKEVRNLKITNGEVDYKAQSTFVEDFTLYKENEGGGNYEVLLAVAPGNGPAYGFNLNHQDEGLREIFGDLRFRQAMSLALDRSEIVETVYLGQAKPQQAVPVDPDTVSFITEAHTSAFTDFDPDAANALLDEMGLVDVDGDGIRERPDGENLTILLQFSNQGGPVRLQELVAGYWADVGIRVDVKEVSSDEYRERGGNNELDVTMWIANNTSGNIVAQDPFMVRPQFGWFWNPGNAILWAEWFTDPTLENAIEPPDYVKELDAEINEFLKFPLGSDESNAHGAAIADIHVDNLFKIGTVGSTKEPVIHHNRLKNFGDYPLKAFDYYWAYNYRPSQWYLDE